MRKTWILAVALGTTLVAATAFAGPRDVAIFVTRMGGDSATAQPYVDRFLRYVESTLGWPAASIKGQFLGSRKEAQGFIGTAQPGIGIMDPPLYYEMRKAWNLKPILQVESTDLNSRKFHVVVKDASITGLGGLAGKKLWTTLADYPKYLSKVVLGGADVSGITLKQIGQAGKGIRAVVRGDADATIVDDEQLSKIKEISGGADLRVIFSSGALPPIPVVVFGTGLPAGDQSALVKTMIAMCGTAKGGPICKEMFIGKFVPVDAAAFSAADKAFGE